MPSVIKKNKKIQKKIKKLKKSIDKSKMFCYNSQCLKKATTRVGA